MTLGIRKGFCVLVEERMSSICFVCVGFAGFATHMSTMGKDSSGHSVSSIGDSESTGKGKGG